MNCRSLAWHWHPRTGKPHWKLTGAKFSDGTAREGQIENVRRGRGAARGSGASQVPVPTVGARRGLHECGDVHAIQCADEIQSIGIVTHVVPHSIPLFDGGVALKTQGAFSDTVGFIAHISHTLVFSVPRDALGSATPTLLRQVSDAQPDLCEQDAQVKSSASTKTRSR